jgi:hypothetical protein
MRTQTYWNQYNLTFRDAVYGPSKGGSIWQLCPLAALLDPSVATVFYDDFWIQPGTKASASGNYVIVEDDGASGTDAVGDAANGVYIHYCDGDDNDEAYLISAHETWLFAAGKSLWFEARVAITQGATNEANWICGLMDNAGADAIVDGGAGPAAEYDGALFYGVDGALTYGFETSNATTQVTTAPASGWTSVSATMMNLGFWFKSESDSDTTATITPYVNGTAGTAHTITLAGLEQMHFVIGVKSDVTAAEEAFSIDYLKIVQIR